MGELQVVPMTLFKNKLGSWVFARPGNLELGEVLGVFEGASLRWRFEGVDAILSGGLFDCRSFLVLLGVTETASSAGSRDARSWGLTRRVARRKLCLLYYRGLDGNGVRKARSKSSKTTQQEQVSKPVKQVSGQGPFARGALTAEVYKSPIYRNVDRLFTYDGVKERMEPRRQLPHRRQS